MENVIYKLAWYCEPPTPVEDPLNVAWGYLVFLTGGQFVFVNERPNDEEILSSPLIKNLKLK